MVQNGSQVALRRGGKAVRRRYQVGLHQMGNVRILRGQGGLLAEGGTVLSVYQVDHRTVDVTVMMERRFGRHEIAETAATLSALQVLLAGNQAAGHLEEEEKEASSDILAPVPNPPRRIKPIFWDSRLFLRELTGNLVVA